MTEEKVMPYAMTRNPIAKKQFLQTIGFQMRCGVPILVAIRSSGIDFPIYQQDAEGMRRDICGGESFLDYFSEEGLEEFSEIKSLDCAGLRKELIIAETNGDLPGMLYHGVGNAMRTAIRTKFLEAKPGSIFLEEKISEVKRQELREIFDRQEMMKPLGRVKDAFKGTEVEFLEEELISERVTRYFDEEVVPDFQDWKYLLTY